MKDLLSIRSYSTRPTEHAHSYNQLVLPLRGMINIRVGTFYGKVSPRECVIVRSNEMHLFTAEKEARFIVADLQQLPDLIEDSPHIVFEISKPLSQYLLFIESQLESELSPAIEQAMLNTFKLLLCEQRLTPKLDIRINNALLYIEQNMSEPIIISDLAQVACLSPTQFKKNFKKQLGITVLEYITSLRMKKAQALLTHTDYPLQIIAEQVGYTSLSAFSRKFSQFFGLSPTKFKQ